MSNNDLTVQTSSYSVDSSTASAIELYNCKKQGKLCSMSFYFNSGSTVTTQWLLICTLANSEFFPSKEVPFSFNDMNGNNFIGRIGTDGRVRFYQLVQGVFQGHINASWFVD